jgi:RNA polymerase sigma factor (sigma-70 family)
MDPASEADYDDLFRREYDAIWRSVRLIVGDREIAREVCQDAFASAFSHWSKVAAYDRPGAWVRRVAIRDAVRVAERERKREDAARSAAADRAGQANVDGPDVEGSSDRIAAALAQLSPNQRAAVVLHHLLDLSVGSVAADLGCSPSTAGVHLHRGRTRLAQILETEADDGRR